MFKDLSEEQRCYTDRNPQIQKEKLMHKVKYLEKENQDLLMDLEDVEATLLINKNMINILMESQNLKESEASIIDELKKENSLQNNQISELRQLRDKLKADNLILAQVKWDKKSTNHQAEEMQKSEFDRLQEALEKKEYTLQLLESRLYDWEKFLRECGKNDEKIRDRLKDLKLNPNVERKKITNVVLENNKLKQQIKEQIDNNETFQ